MYSVKVLKYQSHYYPQRYEYTLFVNDVVQEIRVTNKDYCLALVRQTNKGKWFITKMGNNKEQLGRALMLGWGSLTKIDRSPKKPVDIPRHLRKKPNLFQIFIKWLKTLFTKK